MVQFSFSDFIAALEKRIPAFLKGDNRPEIEQFRDALYNGPNNPHNYVVAEVRRRKAEQRQTERVQQKPCEEEQPQANPYPGNHSGHRPPEQISPPKDLKLTGKYGTQVRWPATRLRRGVVTRHSLEP